MKSVRRLSWVLLLGLSVVSLFADARIPITAKVNGQLLKLAFDTGAEELVIFSPVAARLHLKVNPPPPGTKLEPGQVLVRRTDPVSLDIMGNTLAEVRLGVVDHPAVLPLDIDGVIGWPNVRNNLWFLQGSALQFARVDELPAASAIWLRLREVRERKILCLELPAKNRAGQTQYLSIDTGADYGVALAPEAWAKWRAARRRQPVTLEAYSVPGASLVIAEFAWADEIEIGGLTLHGLSVREMDRMEQINFADNVAILGLAGLLRTDCVLDGKNGFAYLNPLRTPVKAPANNRLGAVFVPDDPEHSVDLVAHVAKDSPAEKAGIRNGDVLLKIDALDVTPWRTQPGILPLRRFFEQTAGTKLHLTLRRKGKVVAVDAVLRNILGPESK